ncbi:MAG: cell division protein ZapA [Tistlia sp.]|uniref:cell division protein ZapA n=1 Tax=Tistlia sp. TaxID=3057121 RepID=UPI0034A19F8E
MGQVALRINGRSYEVTCNEGQEEHLRGVAAYFDGRVREVAGAVGQVGEGRLLVIAALLVADELFDAKEKLAGGAPKGDGESDGEAAESLEEAAARIDALARTLAQA